MHGLLLAGLFLVSCSGVDSDIFEPSARGGASSSGGATAGGRSGAATKPEGGGAGDWEGGATDGGASGESGGAGGSAAGARAGAGGSAGAGGEGGTRADEPPLGGCRIELRCDEEIVDDEKRSCSMHVYGSDGGVQYSGQAAIEYRGRSSIAYPKKNYSFELRESGEVESPTNLFGMGQESDWILDGSWLDRSFMRNDLVFELFRAAGHYAPESRYCTLSLNGEERGIYRLCERIKRDDDRLALAEDDGTGRTFIVKQDAGGPLQLDLGLESDWALVYPNQARATEAQRSGVQAWLDALAAAVDQALGGDAEPVFELLSLETTVDWILVEELSKNVDAYNLSLHFHRDTGGRASPTPWDLDLSFGQPTLNHYPEVMNEGPEGWISNRTKLIRALSRSDALRGALGSRWRALRAGPYADANVERRLDRFSAALEPTDIAKNFEIWPIADVDFERFYPPYSIYRIGSHAEEVQKLRGWIRARLRWMDANIDGYPAD